MQENQENQENHEYQHTDSSNNKLKLNPSQYVPPKNFMRLGFVWRPVPNIVSTTVCLLITGIIFLAIGIILIVFSNKITDFSIRYDDNEECLNALDNTSNSDNKCIVQIHLEKEFKEPVFIYYQLNNFYQNHRRYLKSKSDSQLKGEIKAYKDIVDDCEPIRKNKDLGLGYTKSWGGVDLDPEGVANPCGLIAKSFFNDTFLLTQSDTNFFINKTSISWKTDNKKYKRCKDSEKIQWIDVEREDFKVWMRTAGLPDFIKLYGRINKDLEPGYYNLTVNNNYDVRGFNGEKHFYLSTANKLGGKNYLIGYAYIVVGAIALISCLFFVIGYVYMKRKEKIKFE